MSNYNKKELEKYFNYLTRQSKKNAKDFIESLTKKDVREGLKMREISTRTLKKDNGNFKEIVNAYYLKQTNKVKKEIMDLLNDETILPLETIEFSAEWKKSRTWGYCPTARGWVNNLFIGQSHASGCGYDKLSSVFNTILRSSKVFKKAIIIQTLRSKAAKKKLPYGIRADEHGIRGEFGGCGVETLTSILKWLGFKRENIKWISGETFDHYEGYLK